VCAKCFEARGDWRYWLQNLIHSVLVLQAFPFGQLMICVRRRRM